MARILVAWECGGSRGHVALLNPVASALRDRGHELLFCYRSVEASARPWPEAAMLAAPFYHGQATAGPGEQSFTEVLVALGLDTTDATFGLLKFWHDLYRHWCPDAVLLEYSPMALYAAAARPMLRYQLGWGFFVPPAINPLPPFRYMERAAAESAEQAERKVLCAVNGAFDHLGLPSVDGLGALYEGIDRTFLRTVPELDHYNRSDDVRFIGKPMVQLDEGTTIDWPAGLGPRVFAYVKQFDRLRALLDALRDGGYRVLVYAAEGAYATARFFRSEHLIVSDIPLATGGALQGADLVICHGGINLIQEALSHGKPLYVIPQQLEQSINAINVEHLGGGKMMPLEADSQRIAADLESLTHERNCRQGAREFASRYRHLYTDKSDSTVAEEIDADLRSLHQ